MYESEIWAKTGSKAAKLGTTIVGAVEKAESYFAKYLYNIEVEHNDYREKGIWITFYPATLFSYLKFNFCKIFNFNNSSIIRF